jgi:hypothetical protein
LPLSPPQTIISVPDQMAGTWNLARGALVVDMGVQVSVEGSYRAPSFVVKVPLVAPPQTITCVPVQTAWAPYLSDGAPRVEVAFQVSVAGSYRPPVLVIWVPPR